MAGNGAFIKANVPLALTSAVEPAGQLLDHGKSRKGPWGSGEQGGAGLVGREAAATGKLNRHLFPASEEEPKGGGMGGGLPLDSLAGPVTSGLERMDVSYNGLSHIRSVLIQLSYLTHLN